MKKALHYFIVIILCSIIWVVLNEEVSVKNVLLGCLLGFCSITCTEQFLIHKEYKANWKLNPMVLFRYLFHLIIQMYISGFITIGKIISGKINPDIVEISTELDDDLLICILANSITLTPGTITVDKEGQKLKVLWLDCISKDSNEAGDMIKGSFEKILKNS
ncbi:multisubunit sodium/proton antiporter, MrpE subunit [Clostridium aceticum]|uniref:Multisubunit sodium/proton antiporter, MrpE subunit n=1 Tax=Clostridium aceticum TaxID=84022 RepID=A0A0G3WG53_9CLOT|nr:Na+/H+ antiporter subunit E [Clostridium aceticum]AKL96419.1 multisubunit sodium/proton antiporter, MrpE subunit [Clostridium aceticum]